MSTHLDLDGLTADLVTEQERHKVVGGMVWGGGVTTCYLLVNTDDLSKCQYSQREKYKTTQVSIYKPAPLVTSYLQPRREDDEPSARQPVGTSLYKLKSVLFFKKGAKTSYHRVLKRKLAAHLN